MRKPITMLRENMQKMHWLFMFLTINLVLSAQVTFAGTSWDTKLDLEPISEQSHYADGSNKRHPKDKDHGEDRSVYITDSAPVEVSYLKIERDTAGAITCERVMINFVASEKLWGVATVIEPWSDATPPTDLGKTWYFIDEHIKTHGDIDKDHKIKVKDDHYDEEKSDEGIFLGVNRVYRVTVTYWTADRGESGRYKRYVTFWLVDLQRSGKQTWEIQYDPDATVYTTFEDIFSDDLKNTGDLSDATAPSDTKAKEDKAKLLANRLVAFFVNGLIAMLILKFGFAIFSMAKSFGGSFGAFVFIFIGIMFAVTAVENVMDLITGVTFGDILSDVTGVDSNMFEAILNPGGVAIEKLTGVDLNPIS